MTRCVALAVALMLACAGGVHAAPPRATPPSAQTHADQTAALAGAYHLEGVMETGSDLLLRADDTFEWAFTYGALDLMAKGHWRAQGDGIELRVEDMACPPQFPQARFERMHLRRDGAELVPSWPWDMDAFRKGAERGAYVPE